MSIDRVESYQLDPERLSLLYLIAKERVIDAGFGEEIDWQDDVSLEKIDESTFLREAAWVVLSTGFRETIVRRRFEEISKAFLYWTSADAIAAQSQRCRMNALTAFGNERKIDAVLEIVERVAQCGIDAIRIEIISRGTQFLDELPFVGPVTACHLAKNLGVPVAKPDRHLVRMATRAGYESVGRMCQTIATVVGDSVAVVDVVMWRYATMTHGGARECWADMVGDIPGCPGGSVG